MSSEQTALTVQVLSLLGWVDGKFDESEHDASEALLQASMDRKTLAAALEAMAGNFPVKADVLAAVKASPAEVSRAAIKLGFTLARADGYLHDGEFAILLELSVAAGFPQAELDRVGKVENLHQAFMELEKLYA